MAQKIIIVLGQRKSGKTTVADKIARIYPIYSWVNAMAFCNSYFVKLHEIEYNQMFDEKEIETWRAYLGAYSQAQRKQDPERFIKPLLEYIRPLNHVVLDNINYFNELDLFMKMGAHPVWVETNLEKRKERGWKQYMQDEEFESEVSSINPKVISAWGGTIIDNNEQISKLANQIMPLPVFE